MRYNLEMFTFFRNIIANVFYRQHLPHKPTKAEIESSEYEEVRVKYFRLGVAIARKHFSISSALLQRELKIPYAISSRLLEYDGVVKSTRATGVYAYSPEYRPHRLVNLGV